MNRDLPPRTAIARGIDLLEWIVGQDRSVTSVEAAAALGLPKPTVHRLAQQLEEAGVLRRAPNSRRFTGAPRLHALAVHTLSRSALGAARHAVLQGLSDEIGETCNCVILDGNRLVYLDRVEANWPMRIHLPVGTRVPLHATASGKTFLALLPPAQRDDLLDAIPLVRHTALTVTDRGRLAAELERTRETRVGVDAGEYIEGLIALAVPVCDARGRICFAIAVHAASARRSLDELRRCLPAMHRAAARLSKLHEEEISA